MPVRPLPSLFVALFVGLLLAAPAAPAQSSEARIVRAFPNLTFTQPIGLENDGAYFYVLEKAGTAWKFEDWPDVAEATVFMDLTDRVSTVGESGLLGLAFHPNYEVNGYFYAYYMAGSDPERSVISRFTRSGGVADLESEVVLIEFEQPAPGQHNGGGMAFGPDGYLYVITGDGQCCFDPNGNSQNPATLLGSLLRIDVDGTQPGLNYRIPPDNPFVGNTEGWREEVFAYGFRNPWRFSFDRETGTLWVADVGETVWEEVNIVEAGENYGWPIMEGPECLGGGSDCDQTGLTLPVHAYTHDVGISITGGHVYRGQAAPVLEGQYVFGDWGLEKMWALDADAPETSERVQFGPPEGASTVGFMTDFAEDANGELYYITYFRGWIYGFESDPVNTEPGAPGARAALELAGPNPFRGATTLAFEVGAPGPVRVAAYDVLGREVAVLWDGPAPATEQTVTFDAAGLSAGLYVVRLEADGVIRTRKVSLVR